MSRDCRSLKRRQLVLKKVLTVLVLIVLVFIVINLSAHAICTNNAIPTTVKQAAYVISYGTKRVFSDPNKIIQVRIDQDAFPSAMFEGNVR